MIYSNGIFKENATYDIALDGEYYTSVTFPNDKSINYENNTIIIKFEDTNSTSIKQPLASGNFLSFYFES